MARGGQRTRRAPDWGGMLSGMGLGAGLMFILDPLSGRRRRKTVLDKAISLAHQSGDATGRATRDLSHRAQGLAAAATRPFHRAEVDDATLTERVRAKLGRVVSHPHAIDVTVQDGRATLRGPILEHEADPLISKARAVRGVQGVEDLLERHQTREGVPALQGGSPRAELAEVMQANWTPGIRCLAATAGSGLVAWGIRRGDGLGLTLGSAGAALLARAGANRPLRKVVGLPGGPRLVDVHKTININAPLHVVYGLWTQYENFPRFMPTLKEVRDHGQGRSRWTVEGPGGIPVSWNAEITRLVPNEVLAWKSLPGSVVPNAGTVQFTSTEEGGTRVDIQLSYDPPAGALGLMAAKLFGADAKSQMDEDLLRMKTFLETGNPPHDAAVPSPEVAPIA
jgi:uncharacterized membrane protein